MACHIRSLTTTASVPYAQLDDAIQQVRATLQLHSGKTASRTEDGKIALDEPDGRLFNVIWIEDEDGRVMRF